MNKTFWIDFLSVRQGACESGFLLCSMSKGEGIQSIPPKACVEEESSM